MWADEEWPTFTGAVDGVPIFCRASGEYYNGKHAAKYVSFQVLVDLVGRPFAWPEGSPGKNHDSTSFSRWNWLARNHTSDEHWLGSALCVTPLKSNMESVCEGRVATKEEKDIFEIVHRKRRNRVEHFFARLNHFNFKYHGCGVRANILPKYFNILMHMLSREMLRSIDTTGRYNYSDTVVFNPRVTHFDYNLCNCLLNDKAKTTRESRNFMVRLIADKYPTIENIRNKRPLRSKKGAGTTYVPKARQQLYKRFRTFMEKRGSKWTQKSSCPLSSMAPKPASRPAPNATATKPKAPMPCKLKLIPQPLQITCALAQKPPAQKGIPPPQNVTCDQENNTKTPI